MCISLSKFEAVTVKCTECMLSFNFGRVKSDSKDLQFDFGMSRGSNDSNLKL